MDKKWILIVPVVVGVAVMAMSGEETEVDHTYASIEQSVDEAFGRQVPQDYGSQPDRDGATTQHNRQPAPQLEARLRQNMQDTDDVHTSNEGTALPSQTDSVAFPDARSLQAYEMAESHDTTDHDAADPVWFEQNGPAQDQVNESEVELTAAESEQQRLDAEEQIAQQAVMREQADLNREEQLPPMSE